MEALLACSWLMGTPYSPPQQAGGKLSPSHRKRRQADTYTSQSTLNRIKASKIVALPTDEAFVAEADIILSIVPPRDAIATARRIVEASRSQNAARQRSERKNVVQQFEHNLVYIDLNAISPKTSKTIAGVMTAEASPAAVRRRASSGFFSSAPANPRGVTIDYVDGGIIGGPPAPKADAEGHSNPDWKKPSLVLSGPNVDQLLNPELQSTLNIRVVGSKIGVASSLKACFASLTKGFTALGILSYTTAHTCGVLDELRDHLTEYAPGLKQSVEGMLGGMAPKAYRWVEEMRQIGETFAVDGGFDFPTLYTGKSAGGNGGAHGFVMPVYDDVAAIYRLVAEDTVLGEETMEKRKRGRDAVDVAACMSEGIRRKKKRMEEGKVEGGPGDVGATWRGTWS